MLSTANYSLLQPIDHVHNQATNSLAIDLPSIQPEPTLSSLWNDTCPVSIPAVFLRPAIPIKLVLYVRVWKPQLVQHATVVHNRVPRRPETYHRYCST
ncbi:hypothetical protein BC938DRAFT_476146 [Jimgerdemannia flammicorona]|uniref:Uncharacterized protein n=1 Tax=Jimgerdemannia flammicorona TaxID=994334 RepID=A0A433QQU9_9FUNG|nr:hypothetical protein BC938DRAFT_476146 [Jimgerdemannia flammicorona]